MFNLRKLFLLWKILNLYISRDNSRRLRIIWFYLNEMCRKGIFREIGSILAEGWVGVGIDYRGFKEILG